MSQTCSAILYSGSAKDPTPLGAFATNGGLNFQGAQPKKATWLAYRASGTPFNCPKPSTDSGTSNCKAIAWGDASDSPNSCVKTLVDLNQNGTAPINWPMQLPAVPTRLGNGVAFTPSTDYPSKCANLGSGTINFTTAGHPPGIYCAGAAGVATTLNIAGLDLTGGDGYTFFALDGAKIHVNGNPPLLKFYWPSACGPRPITRAATTCFGRSTAGYDPMTLLYATNQTNDTNNCANDAICLDGHNGSFTGDIFAPKPDVVFPPGPPVGQTGGTIFVAGGAVSSGSGFFESWNFTIQGNTGSYSGTGTPIVIPGGTHTTTDTSTVQTIIQPGTTDPGTTVATTIGTDIGLGE
jgi:hypothetical protein